MGAGKNRLVFVLRQAQHERNINRLHVHPEPSDSPFVLTLSKDERFAQDRPVEG